MLFPSQPVAARPDTGCRCPEPWLAPEATQCPDGRPNVKTLFHAPELFPFSSQGLEDPAQMTGTQAMQTSPDGILQ